MKGGGHRLKDMTGERINRLVVLSRATPTKQGQARWLWRCDSFGSIKPNEIPHCECDEVEDTLREQLVAARAEIDVLRQECRERERAAEVSAKLLTDQRDEARAQLEQLQPILSVLGDWDWAQVDADGCMDDAAFHAVTRALAHIARERAK